MQAKLKKKIITSVFVVWFIIWQNQELTYDLNDILYIILAFEIPDDDGERLMTPALIKEYICDKEDVFE